MTSGNSGTQTDRFGIEPSAQELWNAGEQTSRNWLVQHTHRSLEKHGVFRHSVYLTAVITLFSILTAFIVYQLIDLDYMREPVSLIMPVVLPILTAFPTTLIISRLVMDLIAREKSMWRQQEKMRLLAEEAARQRRAAEYASAAKSSLLANMSHELRTPLNAIIGFSEIFQDSLFENLNREQIQQYAQDINVSGRLLLSLVNDLLELARIEAGGREFAVETVHVCEKIDEVCRIVMAQADEGKVTLSNTCKDPDLTLQTDDRALRQVLLNLLSNAIKFTPEGGTVTVSVEQTPDWLTLHVADTGIGIKKSELGLIFEPFRQVDNSYTRAKAGSGLGLALVRTMVTQQGGTVAVTSTVGEGSTFTLKFPRQSAEPHAQQA